MSIVSEDNTPNCDEVLSNNGVTHTNVAPISQFQSTIPPLAHFENIRYEEIGPSLGMFSICEDYNFEIINPINLEDTSLEDCIKNKSQLLYHSCECLYAEAKKNIQSQ